jgi:hypothetical protein
MVYFFDNLYGKFYRQLFISLVVKSINLFSKFYDRYRSVLKEPFILSKTGFTKYLLIFARRPDIMYFETLFSASCLILVLQHVLNINIFL